MSKHSIPMTRDQAKAYHPAGSALDDFDRHADQAIAITRPLSQRTAWIAVLLWIALTLVSLAIVAVVVAYVVPADETPVRPLIVTAVTR